MSPEELRDLADDIVANGLIEPITLTPDGLLLEGRNRAIACAMVGVEPRTVRHAGDPWLYSISKKARRRHMTIDQIAYVVAGLATRGLGSSPGRQGGGSRDGASFEAPSIAEAAAAAGVPKTAVESAKVVRDRGTEEEKAAVRSGKAKLRKTADTVRSRARPKAEGDPIDGVARALLAKFSGADAGWRTRADMARGVGCARSAMGGALDRLGSEIVKRRVGPHDDEYLIGEHSSGPDAGAASAAYQRAELGSLKTENERLRKEVARLTAENEQLRNELAEARRL
jgi:hypothetical protein